MNIEVPFIDTFQDKDSATEINLSCNNWPQSYPYSPEVKVRLWHDNKSLFLNYLVKEKYVAAKIDYDNGKVSKDSCVEFFIAFDDEGYYNLEANCIGKILLSHRKGRKIDVEYATPDVLNTISRNPSLGTDPINCHEEINLWTLNLEIPLSVFFKHDLKEFGGLTAKCNIYKCGDELPLPHFLSCFPIKTDSPDFHRPEFFGTIYFKLPKE